MLKTQNYNTERGEGGCLTSIPVMTLNSHINLGPINDGRPGILDRLEHSPLSLAIAITCGKTTFVILIISTEDPDTTPRLCDLARAPSPRLGWPDLLHDTHYLVNHHTAHSLSFTSDVVRPRKPLELHPAEKRPAEFPELDERSKDETSQVSAITGR